MAAKDDILRQLSDQKKMQEDNGPAMVQEWRTSLASLYRQFAEWLSDAAAAGLLTVEEVAIGMKEERLPPYYAPSLKIVSPRGEAIHIVPKARIVVGALGRVDFECGPKRLKLIRRSRDIWQFAELAPDRGGWDFKDLTEESFWESVKYLLS